MQRRTAAFTLILALAVASATAVFAQPAGREHTQADRDFVLKAMQTGDAEIAQARAERTSKDATIRAFARRMILDHVAANTQLAQLAEQKGIPYSHANVNVTSNPGNVKPDTATRPSGGYAARALSPRAYMQREVTDHKAAIALFKDAAKTGTDQDIKVFIGNTLPTLEGHLKMAQDYLAGRRVTMPPLAPSSENNMQAATPSPKP
ncbi:MAG: DUF4142 domain-containing protein [Candidatus Eremiobacteraeota bacterium]|nr:DUF4142 domain-containing protein [Candidatus Eremiobacteraeota bacterium]